MSRIVDAYGKIGPLRKSGAKIIPNVPEENDDINATDIGRVVDAVKGYAYATTALVSEPGPCACPSAVTCGAMPCACDAGLPCAACGGGQCVKTCIGGGNAGLPCLNNDPVAAHCPGGTCGNAGPNPGFCRDKCARCKLPL